MFYEKSDWRFLLWLDFNNFIFCFFLLIRKYTNGYHAATYSKCLFHSILLEVVLLASISYVFHTGLALLFLTIVSDYYNFVYCTS